jgi:hypothetical protein
MTHDAKLQQGTAAWFEMVGTLMRNAATRSGLSQDLNVSLVERYSDGSELGDGLVQGIRFEIVAGAPSFRVGARPGESADVTVEVTAAAARALNLLFSTDPDYERARARLNETGEMRVDGDPSRLGCWLDAIHDPIVDRTK